MKLRHVKKWSGECGPLQKGLNYAVQCSREAIRAMYLIPVVFVLARVQDISRDVSRTRAQLERLPSRLEYFVANDTNEFEDILASKQDVALALANKRWKEAKTDLKTEFNEAIVSVEKFNPLSLFEERPVEEEIRDDHPAESEEVILASSVMNYQCAEGELSEDFDQ